MEDEEDWWRGEDICGGPVRALTHEEWKIINSVVEGVQMQEIARLEYNGMNRGKKKKRMRELRGLQSSINYESNSRKTRELKTAR